MVTNTLTNHANGCERRTNDFWAISYDLTAAVRKSSFRRPFVSSWPGRWSCPRFLRTPPICLRTSLIVRRPYVCLRNNVRTTQGVRGFFKGDPSRIAIFLRWSYVCRKHMKVFLRSSSERRFVRRL